MIQVIIHSIRLKDCSKEFLKPRATEKEKVKDFMKKKYFRKKGFTLVELIVVLVILGILAAFLIPSLTAWIKRGKQSELIVECRSSVMAAQSLYVEAYGDQQDISTVTVDMIKELAEVKGTITQVEHDTSSNMVKHLTYERDGDKVVYCREPENCLNHSEVYNFDEGGSDSESTPVKSGVVTLEDASGNKYTFTPKHNWDDIKGKDNVTLVPGDIVSDGNSTYIWANTQEGKSTRKTSFDDFVKANSTKLIKLDNQSVLMKSDLTLNKKITKGTISTDGKNCYVAVDEFKIESHQANKVDGNLWPWKSCS